MFWSRRGRRGSRGYGFHEYSHPVPVAAKRVQARREATELEKQGAKLQPVVIEGRAMAHTFWGKAWCNHIEGYSDFSNRLPRGRTYARNGAVIDLRIEAGAVRAKVSGSSLYTVKVDIAVLEKHRWASLVRTCTGKIDSLVELLSGKLSTGVMEVLCDAEKGLFPGAGQLKMSCSCPDGARLCKHLAAVLYGVGARLDHQPELFFLLRGVEQLDLVRAAGGTLGGAQAGSALETEELSTLFGIELDAGRSPAPVAHTPAKEKRAPGKKAAVVNPPPSRQETERRMMDEPARARAVQAPKTKASKVKAAKAQKAQGGSGDQANYRAALETLAAALKKVQLATRARARSSR